ncbi:DUF3299 domain-containing protein [Vibrio quintilis]|nr:DUF3299 domain-containing protein [Vibrio quintilis]
MKRLTQVQWIYFLLGCVLSGGVFSEVAIAAKEPQIMSLDWEDLIPEQERMRVPVEDDTPVDHDSDTPPQAKLGSVRHELNNQLVKIPGFVIPLEGDDKTVTEFLLVPFLGACIHVPPPPPNQIVYVKFKHGAPIKKLWDIVNVVGYLKTETMNLDLGEAGYVLYGSQLEDFQPES